jgi:hypothetical protein
MLALAAWSAATSAATPLIFSTPAHQAPVRARPDELLLVAGTGLASTDRIVYRAVTDDIANAKPPGMIPKTSNRHTGVAETISAGNVPHSLTVKMPAAVSSHTPYQLWIRTAQGTWSRPVSVNDARPLWFTPSFAYRTKSMAGLPRRIKIVGRNLDPLPGQDAMVRLRGPAVVNLAAVPPPAGAGGIAEFVTVADLPTTLQTGTYKVEISVDGRRWQSIAAQKLQIEPDPPQPALFDVRNYCGSHERADDSACIVRAIDAAERVRGTILLGPGTWRIGDAGHSGASADGIVVPVGVGIAGAGAGKTRVMRLTTWTRKLANNRQMDLPVFSLLGSNEVRDLTFVDEKKFRPSDWGAAAVQLGLRHDRRAANARHPPGVVARVQIHQTVFDRTFFGIVDGGSPIRELFVAHNVFGAYRLGLFPAGDPNNVDEEFRIDDSVVAFNEFHPGSYIDVSIRQGTIASEMGAAHRVDFSHNAALGASRSFLTEPERDVPGWRAAFFWHLAGNQEMLLVSQNRIECAGDKTGDGEAISFDNNRNRSAFRRVSVVRQASADWIEVDRPTTPSPTEQTLADSHFSGFWLQIAAGTGVGQSRKIVAYSVNSTTGRLGIQVAPAFDVAPAVGVSAVAIAKAFWQTYVLDNDIDQRSLRDGRSLCTKGTRRDSQRDTTNGGTINVWAQAMDSVVADNRQWDTSGIWLHYLYRDEPIDYGHSFLSFIDIMRNKIVGEYDWNSDCSWSGIYNVFGLSAPNGAIIPRAGFGISISRNDIRHADGPGGGGISLSLGWNDGPAPHNWQLVTDTIVQHNAISDMAGDVPPEFCAQRPPYRSAIALDRAGLVWRTLLYKNKFTSVAHSLRDTANRTLVVTE